MQEDAVQDRTEGRFVHTRQRRRAHPATGRGSGTRPLWLLAVPIVLGVPRTALSDLGLVRPEGSWVYYVLALTPFVVWLAIALIGRTTTPLRDHLLAGVGYGLSLAVVHEVLWPIASSIGTHPPEGAIRFAEQFEPALRGPAEHGYSLAIALMIGVGVGASMAVVATLSTLIRGRRGA